MKTTTLLRPLASLLSPGGRRGRLSILIYHRVLPEHDPIRPFDTSAAEFRWQMALLAREFTPLALPQALRLLANGRLPPRAVAVTFDDGYGDNFTVALPILRDCGVPATFFIATGFLNGGRMWNDTLIETVRRLPTGCDLGEFGLGNWRLDSPAERLRLIHTLLERCKYLPPEQREYTVSAFAARAESALPDDLMLTDRQLLGLAAAGMTIGGHTVSHPILTRLPEAAARHEISAGKQHLEALLNQPVELFAYPNGQPGRDYLPRHAALARELGFRAALATRWGVSTAVSDPFQLPRFTPWDLSPERFMARLLWNCRNADR